MGRSTLLDSDHTRAGLQVGAPASLLSDTLLLPTKGRLWLVGAQHLCTCDQRTARLGSKAGSRLSPFPRCSGTEAVLTPE